MNARRRVIEVNEIKKMDVPEKTELRCYVCGESALPGATGWEYDEQRIGGSAKIVRAHCPKHRSQPALTTLGELIAARNSR